MRCPDCKSKDTTYAGYEDEYGDMSQCEDCGVIYPSDYFVAEMYAWEETQRRLHDIQIKLDHIPIETSNTAHYYIFYKEDVRFLLSLIPDIYKEDADETKI